MKARIKGTEKAIDVVWDSAAFENFSEDNLWFCRKEMRNYKTSELEFIENEKPIQTINIISGMTQTLFKVIAFSISAIISAVSVFKTYEQHNWLLFTVSIVLTIWCLFRFTKNCDKLPK